MSTLCKNLIGSDKKREIGNVIDLHHAIKGIFTLILFTI
jgi:hypothetical protein